MLIVEYVYEFIITIKYFVIRNFRGTSSSVEILKGQMLTF